jgi:hypothetical protein
MTFFIDDWAAGHFTKDAPGEIGAYDYDVLGFSNDSIPFGKHQIKVQIGGTTGNTTMAMFDYMVYT